MSSLWPPQGTLPWDASLKALWDVGHADTGKHLDRVSVLEYGAKGDGSTDDTAAINTAIAAAAGRELYFPATGAVYKTGGGHILDQPISVRGGGRGTNGAASKRSVLSLANGANADLFTIKQKFVDIRDLGLYGNKGAQSGTSRGIVFDATVAIAYVTLADLWVDDFLGDNILVACSGTSVSETSIRRVETRNSSGKGINVATGANDIELLSVQAAQNQLSGIYMGASGKVIGCHSWGNGQADTTSDYSGLTAFGGVEVIGGQYESNGLASIGHGRGIDLRGRNNQVVGAQVYLNAGNGIYAFVAAVADLVIACNAVYDNSQAGGASGIVIDTLTDAVVCNNMLSDTQAVATQNYGILEVNNPNRIVKIGNVARGNKTAPWSLGAGAANLPLAANIATLNIGT